MSPKEYFKDWWCCFDEKELNEVMTKLQILYKQKSCTPSLKNVFKAFELCSRKQCKVVFISQDPYPQPNIATGLAFANSKDQHPISPSLNILKNCILDLENPHNLRIFDPTLESIATQGVLLLNSSLTTEVNKVNAHQLLWRTFIEKFLHNLCMYETGLIFVLFGQQAISFKPLLGKYNHIIECPHPAYCARTDTKLPDIFTQINQILLSKYGETIQWYQTI